MSVEIPRKKKEKTDETKTSPDINTWLDDLDLDLIDKHDPKKVNTTKVEPRTKNKVDILLREKQWQVVWYMHRASYWLRLTDT